MPSDKCKRCRADTRAWDRSGNSAAHAYCEVAYRAGLEAAANVCRQGYEAGKDYQGEEYEEMIRALADREAGVEAVDGRLPGDATVADTGPSAATSPIDPGKLRQRAREIKR